MKEDASEDKPVHGPRSDAKTGLAAFQEELDGPCRALAAEMTDFRDVTMTSFCAAFTPLPGTPRAR